MTSEAELHSLIGLLLHVCEVVRPWKNLVRRMVNHVGLPPVRAWGEKPHESYSRAASFPRIPLGPEFHADVSLLSF